MHARHFLQLIALSAVWGASFPLIRIAAPAFGPLAMACLRCALGAAVLTALMRVASQSWPGRGHWRSLVVLSGLTVVAPFVFFNAAGLVLPAGYSAVLNAMAPLFGVLAGALFGVERITGPKLAGCAAGLGGVALLVQLGPVPVDWRTLAGVAACVAASASYGFGAILMKRASLTLPPLAASASVHVAGALLLLAPAAATAGSIEWRADALIALAVLGTFTSGFMYWFSMRLMQQISASAATSSAFMIPLFGVTWGGLFLGEPVTAGMIPGVALVLLACALVTGFNPFKALRRD